MLKKITSNIRKIIPPRKKNINRYIDQAILTKIDIKDYILFSSITLHGNRTDPYPEFPLKNSNGHVTKKQFFLNTVDFTIDENGGKKEYDEFMKKLTDPIEVSNMKKNIF